MQSKINQIIILFALLLFGNFQCGEPIEPQVFLKTTVKLTPEQKTYSVGDTIDISLLMKDNEIFDLISQKTVSLDKLSISYSTSIEEHKSKGDGPSFDFLVDTTLYSDVKISENGVSLKYGCPTQQKDYRFDLKMVLKNPGIFILGKSYGIDNVVSCDSSLVAPNISYLFDVESTNAELHYRIGSKVYSGESNEEFFGKRRFWFEVVE